MTQQLIQHLAHIGKGVDEYEEVPKPSVLLMMGVEHFLKKVWHEASELPEEGKLILVRYGDNTVYVGRFKSASKREGQYIYELTDTALLAYIRFWAYVEDIIPNE